MESFADIYCTKIILPLEAAYNDLLRDPIMQDLRFRKQTSKLEKEYQEYLHACYLKLEKHLKEENNENTI